MRTGTASRLSVAALAALAALALAGPPAGARPREGTDPPVPADPPAAPNLQVTALSVAPAGEGWSVAYTVGNAGTATAPPSRVSFAGGGVATEAAVPGLVPGAGRSGSFTVPRADCFVMLRAVADAAGAVREVSESDNARQALGVAPPCPARYRVTATAFKALDESGVDWTGSDEPYWVFSTVSGEGTARSRATQVFGDVDSGETRAFGFGDSCVWGCGAAGEPASFGVGFSVQLWEQDLGHVDQTLYDTAKAFQVAGPILTFAGAAAWVGATSTAMGTAMDYILGWADDDLLGNATYAFSADYLAGVLPGPGTGFTDTRVYEGSGARYRLSMRVTRVV